MKQRINRILYLSFIIIGIFSWVMDEFLTTAGLFGLAILFDPFDINQTWRDKPYWQKAVFVGQGMLVIGMFVPLMFHYWSNW